MKKLLAIVLVCLSSLALLPVKEHGAYAGPGDTTVVQTFIYDSSLRAGVFIFPDDTSITYEKIIMLYSMRCKDGQVSTSGNTNLGCGEWDYNCYTFIVDSSQTDSLLTLANSHFISGTSNTTFDYTTAPVYSYIQYDQQQVIYNSTISENTAAVGNGSSTLSNPLGASAPVSKTQFMFTAAELSAAGFTADSITGMRLDLSSLGSGLQNLRINIKTTTQPALNPDLPETAGFTNVYFLNTTIGSTGIHQFNFHQPFWWDGTSSIIIEFTYTNTSAGTDNIVNGHTASFDAALTSTAPDNYLTFNNNTSLVQMNSGVNTSISTGEVTVAFWAYGNPSILPTNTTIMEAFDANGKKQLNIHLPWGDSNVYWDCGNDGTNYDRINKLATAAEYEGKWNFWAFSKNVATGEMKIYLNGNLWHSATQRTRPISIDEWTVGKAMVANTGYYGNFDELSVWNKALDLAAVQQIMYNDITPSHPDYAFLKAYYHFNESSGNIATDASANGFDSEIYNPTRRAHTGESLFRNFSVSTARPNTVFISGVYNQTVSSIPVLDSLLNPATSIISYAVNATGHGLDAIDTMYVWPSGYTYIYNGAGVVIDSIPVASQSNVTITELQYYQTRPMAVELINFITPYGINLNMNGLIGKTWAFDVTDFAPVLRGPRHMEMRDGIYQEDIDIKFVFYEGTPARNVKSIQQIWPNGSWVFPSYNDILNNRYFYPVNVPLDPSASMFKIRSAISGHGQEGEFIARNHTIKLNNSINYSRSVWKECATNPIYPQGGTWIYDRAGWCPGAVVDNKDFEITNNVTPGTTINLDYLLPVISNPGSSTYRINNQLVSYGAANFTNDAAVDYVKSPSQRVEFQRLNPLCNEPVIAIKNTGSNQLTSVDIVYGRTGGTMSTYNWTGTLDFLQSVEVVLPQPAWTSSSTNEFVVYVTNPNAQADQYAWNDTLHSAFNTPAQLPSGLVFEFKTNNYFTHNTYTLKDSQGNILITRTGAAANTIYRDTLYLANDCYTVNLTDLADDGLSFWANTAQGNGYFRIRNVTTNTIVMNFNADFGDNIYQQFTVGYVLPVNEIDAELTSLNVYPNPASGLVTAEFSMPLNSQVNLSLINMLGETIMTEQVNVTQEVEKFTLDVTSIESGIYYLVAETAGKKEARRVAVIGQ